MDGWMDGWSLTFDLEVRFPGVGHHALVVASDALDVLVVVVGMNEVCYTEHAPAGRGKPGVDGGVDRPVVHDPADRRQRRPGRVTSKHDRLSSIFHLRSWMREDERETSGLLPTNCNDNKFKKFKKHILLTF